MAAKSVDALALPIVRFKAPWNPGGSSLGFDLAKLSGTAARLAALGIDPPPAVAQRLAEMDELRAARRSVISAKEDPTPISVRGDGHATPAWQAAADDLSERERRTYAEAVNAFREAAPTVIEDLRRKLADVLDIKGAIAEKGASFHDINRMVADRAAHYEEVHAIAKDLRWALGDLAPGTGTDLWWRFRRPDLAHSWLIGEAERRLNERPKIRDGVNMYARGRGGVEREDGTKIYFSTVHGYPIGVGDVRSEWEPDVVTASEVLDNIARFARELGVEDIVPARSPTRHLTAGGRSVR